jgi:molybdate transport system permease protein
MSNRYFRIIQWSFFIVTVLFLTVPLCFLVLKGMQGIVECMQSDEVMFSIKTSLKMSVLSTVICMIAAVPVSCVLNTLKGMNKNIWTKVLFMPMSLPHLVSGIALLLVFGRNGIGDILFDHYGIDFIFTPQGIVLAQLFINLPFAINDVLAALEELDPKMVFVARSMGCNEFQAFKNVTLPLLKRALISNSIMTWTRALGEFGAVLMVAGSIQMKTEVIPTAIFLSMSSGNLDMAAGISVILMIISWMGLWLFDRILIKQTNGIFQ